MVIFVSGVKSCSVGDMNKRSSWLLSTSWPDIISSFELIIQLFFLLLFDFSNLPTPFNTDGD
jgi:hypothetical protein